MATASLSPGMPMAHGDPAELGLCPLRVAALVQTLQSEIDRGRLPGAVVAVARHGKLALFESLGQQDPLAGNAMRRDAIFRLYSMTKPVVSVAALMLLEQGKFLLSDPVAKYLPEFADQQVAVEHDGQSGGHVEPLPPDPLVVGVQPVTRAHRPIVAVTDGIVDVSPKLGAA